MASPHLDCLPLRSASNGVVREYDERVYSKTCWTLQFCALHHQAVRRLSQAPLKPPPAILGNQLILRRWRRAVRAFGNCRGLSATAIVVRAWAKASASMPVRDKSVSHRHSDCAGRLKFKLAGTLLSTCARRGLKGAFCWGNWPPGGAFATGVLPSL